MSFVSGFQSFADEMIRFFGSGVATISRPVAVGYNTNTIQYTTINTTSFSIPVAPVDIKFMQKIEPAMVVIGTQGLYIPYRADYTPAINDQVGLHGKTYQIVDVIAYETQAENAAYFCQLAG